MFKNDRRSGFRPDIEGLRGIAVLVVVGFHCKVPGFSGGFAGVDVFFVLSGYLITRLLVSEIEKTAKLSLLQFYSRRIRRLLPAAALMLIVTMLLGSLIMGPGELSYAARAARGTAVYLSNVFFARNAANYFEANVETNPMLHTWSLAVEEQFYMFWPLLIMAGLQALRSRKALIAILSGLTLVSLCISIWTTANGSTFAFYQLPARAWEFGFGGLAALLAARWMKRLPGSFWMGMGWLGFGSILASAYLIPGGENFPGWLAIAPVLGTVAALMAGAELPARGVGVLLGTSPMQFLGKMSYSWYLWHWPFLVMAQALKPEITVLGKLAVSVAALLVATIAHHLVENPIRFSPYLIKRPGITVGMGMAITAVSLITAVGFWKFADYQVAKPEMNRIVTAAFDVSRIPRDKCVAVREYSSVRVCNFGDTDSRIRVVLLGDSHATQWFNPLETIARERGWKFTTILKSGCPAADLYPPNENTALSESCVEWREEAFRQIETMKPEMVIMVSATIFVENVYNRDYAKGVTVDQWKQSTERTLRRLSAVTQTVLIRDNPLPWTNIPACLGGSLWRPSWIPSGSCEMERDVCLNPDIFEAEAAAARNFKNVYLLDMTDQFCSDEVCWPLRNGEIIYRDDDHITGRFADSLRPVLELRLASVFEKMQSPGRAIREGSQYIADSTY